MTPFLTTAGRTIRIPHTGSACSLLGTLTLLPQACGWAAAPCWGPWVCVCTVKTSKAQEVQKATWMGGTNPGLPAPTCMRALPLCRPLLQVRWGLWPPRAPGSILWGGPRSVGPQHWLQGTLWGSRLFPDPSTWCLPDSETDTARLGPGHRGSCLGSASRFSSVQFSSVAQLHPSIRDKWSGGSSKSRCTCCQPASAASCAPTLPWPRHPCPGLLGHGPGSQPCQSLNLLALAPPAPAGSWRHHLGHSLEAPQGVTVNARPLPA